MELMGRGEWVPGGTMGVPSAAIRRELPRGESSNSARAEDRQEIPQPRPPRPEPAPPEPDPQPPMPKPPV